MDVGSIKEDGESWRKKAISDKEEAAARDLQRASEVADGLQLLPSCHPFLPALKAAWSALVAPLLTFLRLASSRPSSLAVIHAQLPRIFR